MSIFTPFSFLEQKDIPLWAPSDFTDVKYWWRADSGVTEVSGQVQSWEDQIAGHQLVQNFSTNPSYTVQERRPTLTTSTNLNSKGAILFDTSSNATYGTVGEYLYSSTAPDANTSGDDVHFLFVMDYVANSPVNAGGTLFGAGTSANASNRVWIDTFNSGNDYRLGNQLGGGGAQVLDTGVTPAGAEAVWFYYDASTGNTEYAINSLTTSTGSTGNGTNGVFDSNTRFNMNGLVATSGGSFLRFNKYYVAEAVVIYGTPTTEDLNNWKTYVNNRYGTIIS